ncbi:MAG: glycosyl hydrolase 115 family protein [Clostridiales bacterium]|nr:glycosyl hydrolase 115 family protein [Clostridiales bacterium]
MDHIISTSGIAKGKTAIIYSDKALPGVKRVAGWVAGDMGAVFGKTPEVLTYESLKGAYKEKITSPVYVATLGFGDLTDKFGIDTSDIAGKREVYKIEVKDGALFIAGSDKRGTVYGLFRLSELLGVSPFIDWLDVRPVKKDKFKLPSGTKIVSKEPSVRYRGFFINDEWPAFGNFCNRNYGGFNAKVYEHVFRLLLRLKGNYMWPAMWSAIFPNDGPGLASAELADELGVVMGMSHHEPCLRQGEEYKYLRGKGSIYGDAWNFLSNEKGITRFWEDGLKRSGKFENVITVGMRGEADTAIMGKEATLKDNIDLLRKVLKTQNGLIRKYVNKDLDSVPRMLALYKEVEPYFYGDENTEGLMGDPELEGVTLMLCDDNFGNLRTVPSDKMRDHKGGYGMYYHFDYHGLPVSFEWFNTSHLPKVWEQMTTAYDFGIRDLWIVNVGDIFTNEYPLSFFLDLAYDFDRWGTGNLGSAEEYTRLLVKREFGGKVSVSDRKKISDLLLGYTRITSARRTEAMNDRIYAPFAFGEAQELLDRIHKLTGKCEKIYSSLKGNVKFSFYELCYLPLMANLNVQRMWLLTTLNHGYAARGSTYALTLAGKINECIEKDKALVEELHSVKGGKWYGMGMSEHIGFNNWCEEENKYPVIHMFKPANKDRLIVDIDGTDQSTEGKFWSGKVLVLEAFLDPSVSEGTVTLSTACDRKIGFKIDSKASYLSFSETEGNVKPGTLKRIKVCLDREKYGRTKDKKIQEFCITCSDGHVLVKVPVNTESSVGVEKDLCGISYWCGLDGIDCSDKIIDVPIFTRELSGKESLKRYISIPAENFSAAVPSSKGGFKVISDYSRNISAVKAYPQDIIFSRTEKNAPKLRYDIKVPAEGEYDITLYANPSNPYGRTPEIYFGISANDQKMKRINMIPEGFLVGDGNPFWSRGVLDNTRKTTVTLKLKAGINSINIFALDPNLVLQKIVITRSGEQLPYSYTGPEPTYRK